MYFIFLPLLIFVGGGFLKIQKEKNKVVLQKNIITHGKLLAKIHKYKNKETHENVLGFLKRVMGTYGINEFFINNQRIILLIIPMNYGTKPHFLSLRLVFEYDILKEVLEKKISASNFSKNINKNFIVQKNSCLKKIKNWHAYKRVEFP